MEVSTGRHRIVFFSFLNQTGGRGGGSMIKCLILKDDISIHICTAVKGLVIRKGGEGVDPEAKFLVREWNI